MICYKITDVANGLFVFLDESSGAIRFSDCPFDYPANRVPKTYTLTGPEEVIYRVIIEKCGGFASYDEIEAALLEKGYYSEYQKGQATFVKMTSEVFSRRLKKENGFDLTTSSGKSLLINSGKKYRIPSLKRCDETGMDWNEDHHVIQPERTLIKSGAENANRFHYSAENISFVGRGQELDFLVQMCEGSDEQFNWIGICGKAGSGKSRLAYELCKHLQAQNWSVYYPCHARANIERISADLRRIGRDTLICFDDTITDMDIIIDFIYSCAENSYSPDHKIRLLLIERDFGDSFVGASDAFRYVYRAKHAAVHRFIGTDGFLYSLPLTSDALAALMRDYIRAVADKRPDDSEVASLLDTLERIDQAKRPLFALFIADAWANGIDTKTWDRTAALEMVSKKEFSKAFDLIKSEYGRKSEQSAALLSLKLVLVVSSILKETALEKVNELSTRIFSFDADSPGFRWILNRLGVLSDDGQMIKQVFPDLISEYISISFINTLDRSSVIGLFRFLISSNMDASTQFTAAAENDYPDLLAAPCNMSALLFLKEELHVRIGEEISEGVSSEALEEFDQITNPEDAGRWLEKNKPNYLDIVHQKLAEMTDFFQNNTERVFRNGPDPRQSSSTYDGDFVFDWRCGYGIATYLDGTVYEGVWNRDKRNGQGKMTWPDGTVYIGEWKNGCRDGFGKMQYADGRAYEGSWQNDAKNGRGKMTWPDGAVYIGEWKSGHRDGCGNMHYPDGSWYEGEWEDDKRHGAGVLHRKDGTVSEGDWLEDEFIRPYSKKE